jgi:GMP synthase (glutamine-hydrolysing)
VTDPAVGKRAAYHASDDARAPEPTIVAPGSARDGGRIGARQVLIVQHVPWEGPGLISQALAGLPTRTVVIAGAGDPPLPEACELAALVVMGGPMNADDTVAYPGLAAERRLLADAVAAGVPTLGVCLGAQLLARALGASVERDRAPEIGWAPITVRDQSDPVVGLLADTHVLHWHSDAFELPAGAQHLASSELTQVQAFRAGDAWGLQFHMEATASLVADWLSTSAMQADARAALGPAWREELERQTLEHSHGLRDVALSGLLNFAALAAARVHG